MDYESNMFTFGKCFAKRNIVCFRYIIKVVIPAFSKYMSLAFVCFFEQCSSAVYQIISIKFSKLCFIQFRNLSYLNVIEMD